MNYLHKFVLFVFCIGAFAACNDDDADVLPETAEYDWEAHQPFAVSYNTFNMPFTDHFKSTPDIQGTVSMSEASGLAWSYANEGMLWSHNDSGNTNSIFLINAATGEIMVRYRLAGANNIDWEDMEISYGPIEGEMYLYLADTGDNNERRPDYSIYRFIEPKYDPAHFGQTITLDIHIDRLRFQFPDGSHDTEGMLVDPLTKDIFLVTKRDVVSMLYVAPYPQTTEDIFKVVKAGDFGFRQASAATASLDGEKVLIKNRQEIFYWERSPGESMVEMLERTPVKAPYVGEPQGEAICFDPDYNYFTLSEELNNTIEPFLYKYFYNQ